MTSPSRKHWVFWRLSTKCIVCVFTWNSKYQFSSFQVIINLQMTTQSIIPSYSWDYTEPKLKWKSLKCWLRFQIWYSLYSLYIQWSPKSIYTTSTISKKKKKWSWMTFVQLFSKLNSSQLAKIKKSIPDISLP